MRKVLSTICVILICSILVSCTRSNVIKLNEEGYTLYELGKYDEAILKFNEAIELDPEDSNSYANRGMVFFETGEIEQAVKDEDMAIELNENNAQAYSNRGYMYLGMGKINTAMEDLNKAIELKDQFNDDMILSITYTSLGTAYNILREYEKSMEYYNKALEIDSENEAIYNALGLTLKDMNRLEEAIEAFDKAIEIDQDYAYAFGNRGYVYYLMEDYELALADANTAIDIDPLIPQVYNTQGLILSALEESDKAIQAFSYALDIWPNYSELYLSRGSEYYKKGAYEKALTDFSQAAEYDNLKGYIQKAYLHIYLEQYEDAVSTLEAYLEHNPLDYDILIEAGKASQKANKLQQSIVFFDRAIEAIPQNVEGYFYKGLSLEYLGQFEEAITLFEKVLEIDENYEEAKYEIQFIKDELL